jgi:hypothetical protein
MEIVIVGMALVMAVISLELATDGVWRSGRWDPRLPHVPIHISVRHGHRPHAHRPVRIVCPRRR